MNSALAVLDAVTGAFAGNQGGVVLALLLILGLAWSLRRCDQKHEEVIAQNHRLSVATVQLIAAVNAQAGAEVVSAASLEEMLQGKPAVRYTARRGPGRRDSDKGRTDAETEAAAGPGGVPP